MIDHIVGRPNPSWKRTQVFLVILFWTWRIVRGNSGPPRVLWATRLNRALKRFTPWQVIVSTLTLVYAVRNFDKILGLNAPEPLARLYSPSYYRATWIATGLDAGFATAMSIRPKWFRDICSVVFSVYYIIYANEADEKLRRFRAVPTVEMLRTTWEKTTNPYLRIFTRLPRISIRRKIHLPRPKGSLYDRPITVYLFFAPPEHQLIDASDLILDFPGGGFVAMNPEHHEERLRMWAVTTGRPVLAVDYGKAPEYPYPFASDEAFDVYRLIVETNGALLGMSGKKLNVVLTGDSAGAALTVKAVVKTLEYNQAIATHNGKQLALPVAVVLSYPALDFNFTSWMTPRNLRILRSEQSSGNLPGLLELAAQKDHLQHVSPLSMVSNQKYPTRKRPKRQRSWKDVLLDLASGGETDLEARRSSRSVSSSKIPTRTNGRRNSLITRQPTEDKGVLGDAESEDDADESFSHLREEDRPIQARVRYTYSQPVVSPGILRSESALERRQEEFSIAVEEANNKASMAVGGKSSREPIGTRLTMTSRTGYFQDRIISPSMMRAMAILYIGPHRNPEFDTDYHLSPILTPAHLLAQFPPLLVQCGEKDPFVDDTVIFAGRIREAKRARKVELDLALSGKSARFGESLRMSLTEGMQDPKVAEDMKRERDKLARESETDWVQMVLFSEWSHGYLQMPTIMPEARAVIEDLAEWIGGAFVKSQNLAKLSVKSKGTKGREHSTTRSPPKPATKAIDPSPLTTDTETDETGITFVPKKQGRGESFDHGSHHRPAVFIVTENHDSSGSDATLYNEHSTPETPKVSKREVVVQVEGADGQKLGARLTGQTITEAELMRRRRLLDAHIFEN